MKTNKLICIFCALFAAALAFTIVNCGDEGDLTIVLPSMPVIAPLVVNPIVPNIPGPKHKCKPGKKRDRHDD